MHSRARKSRIFRNNKRNVQLCTSIMGMGEKHRSLEAFSNGAYYAAAVGICKVDRLSKCNAQSSFKRRLETSLIKRRNWGLPIHIDGGSFLEFSAAGLEFVQTDWTKLLLRNEWIRFNVLKQCVWVGGNYNRLSKIIISIYKHGSVHINGNH